MADRLRDEMRKGGVDPAEHRPKVGVRVRVGIS
jgi:hypothetical protein